MLARIAKLTPDTAAKWGNMDAPNMMQHCRIVAESILSRRDPEQRPTPKQRIIRTLIMRVVGRIPKGRQQPKAVTDAMAAQPRLSFEEERQRLLDATARFASFEGTMSGRHPIFGPMKTANWGRFAWMHLDHHLRQFGV
jgi:hypothetical protein